MFSFNLYSWSLECWPHNQLSHPFIAVLSVQRQLHSLPMYLLNRERKRYWASFNLNVKTINALSFFAVGRCSRSQGLMSHIWTTSFYQGENISEICYLNNISCRLISNVWSEIPCVVTSSLSLWLNFLLKCWRTMQAAKINLFSELSRPVGQLVLRGHLGLEGISDSSSLSFIICPSMWE